MGFRDDNGYRNCFKKVLVDKYRDKNGGKVLRCYKE